MVSKRQIHILFLVVLCYIGITALYEMYVDSTGENPNTSRPLVLKAEKGELYLVPSDSHEQKRGQGDELRYSQLAPFFFAPISVNVATFEMLLSIPGIGPVMAKKIIAFREQYGTISHLNELLQIQGVGPKKLEQFKMYLTL